MRRPIRAAAIMLALSVPAVSAARAPGAFQSPDHATTRSPNSSVTYRVTIPEPEHHWLQVEATFTGLGTAPLDAHMSRSSPGRYALHEFAKNVSWVEAYDGAGKALPFTRPTPYEWNVAGDDGTVRIVYRIFGDLVDGTYLAVDTSHAHMNMPATFMWADGLEDAPIRVTFVEPAGHTWKVATQLYPTSYSSTFTAPNLQYFMDSPTEFSDFVLSTFTVPNADGTPTHFRIAAHSDGAQADVDALAALVKRLVTEDMQVYGEFPTYEPGTYTFILDYEPWDGGDGMEHRNSTCITSAGISLRTPQGREQALSTISHEFFHNWNVERIRPVGLEPFDFARANITCCLWLAEGFTQYYGPLQLYRAGLSQAPPVQAPNAVINGSGRLVRSAVQMSQYAVFSDAARSVDPTDAPRTFISYYTYGSAIALALDLSIRELSNSRLGLDDYMRLLWTRFGKPGGPAPGLVGHPYSLQDLRAALADLTGNPAFANSFFDKYIEGREVAEYGHLLAQAGYLVRPANPGRAWVGSVALAEEGDGLSVGAAGRGGGAGTPVPFNSPLYLAGIDEGDTIVAIDDAPATMAAWRALADRRPGDSVALRVVRRDGTAVRTIMTLAADPTLATVPIEDAGGTLTAAQQAFRQAWLGSKVK